MNKRLETIKILEAHGFEFYRHGGKHDMYINRKTNQKIPIKRHDFDESDQRYILKEANIGK